MCIGIIRNNSLVDGRARAESNPGHWASHALLHMAAKCVNHSATKAGYKPVSYQNEQFRLVFGTAVILGLFNNVFKGSLGISINNVYVYSPRR